MKIVVIGDIHGSQLWKQVVTDNADADKYVFIGDYFDSFDISCEKQCLNLQDIMQFKQDNPTQVELLVGNHDLGYLMKENQGISGRQSTGKYMIEPLIETHKQHLKACYVYQNLIFTHAGISEAWLKNNFVDDSYNINDPKSLEWLLDSALQQIPQVFVFDGTNPYGDNPTQTPLWIRPSSLMRSSKNIKAAGNIQIVGHTQMHSIDIKGKATGGNYTFIDTLNSQSREYLVWQDGVFTVHTVTTENYK